LASVLSRDAGSVVKGAGGDRSRRRREQQASEGAMGERSSVCAEPSLCPAG